MQGLTSAQRELADLYRVATDFVDWQGQQRDVDPETVVCVLAALGIDARDPDDAERALDELRQRREARALPLCIVLRDDQTFETTLERDPPSTAAWVALEDGGRVDLAIDASLTIEPGLPLGYHALHLVTGGSEQSTPLIVTPSFLGLPERLADRRACGLAAQLYSVRSRDSWGVGDLADLRELTAWSAKDLDADYVLLNPLGAAETKPPMEPSPYLPTSRAFVNPLYLRVEDIAEYADLPSAERAEVESLRDGLRTELAGADVIDRDAAWRAKAAALRLLHDVPRSAERQRAYADFVRDEGDDLTAFATWCAVSDAYGSDTREWPADLGHPESPAVQDFRDGHEADVDFYCWLQWLLDQQLHEAQHSAVDDGMALGIVHDLAVGVHPTGADVWAHQDTFASAVSVGAPPDAFNQRGQDWSQPPWRPDRLVASGYAPFRRMISRLLRHAGGIRVDHIIGMFRLWWIPDGLTPDKGTYVRYDHEALIGILALEGHRAGAVVVGEDLGNVEQSARDYLRQRGILGTSILWFERDEAGRPLAPQEWREYSMASVTTHDLPPTAAYLAGSHVELREELGLLTRPLDEERAADAEDRGAWLDRLRDEHLLAPDADTDATVDALYEYLALTPARLVCVALTDVVGDVRTQNQPGTTDEYPNWRVPLSGPDRSPLLLEDVIASSGVRKLFSLVDRRMADGGPPAEV